MIETLLTKVRLGRTDVTVSPVCFGASGLSDMPDTFGYSVSAERAAATVRAILDGPTNFLDKARFYGMGRRE
jgi:D-threo-aldose 1-dehydrogenase